jgi:predicted metal-dependent hydrolase
MTLGTSDRYQLGIRHFNAREFYDAHEVWEDVWRESHGMEKRFLQGLIQTAVALHHHSTGNVVGACSLMERALRNLAGCPGEFGGIRVRELLEALGAWRGALVAREALPVCPLIVSLE